MTESPLLAPRANPDLLGQEKAEETLLRAFDSGRLPHAWLLTGARGIGKATLAYRFARHVLAAREETAGLFGDLPAGSLEMPPDDPIFRRVAAEGHSDLMTLERRADDAGRMRSVIQVEDVRKAITFLHMTAGEGGWRVLIVDSVDEMNRNAANALLKVLEEPPEKALLLLVSHAPGRLLPTIRSRCCHLPLSPLPPETIMGLLERYTTGISADEAAAIARLSEGSLGRGLDLWESGGLEVYGALMKILGGAPNLEMKAVHAYAERLAKETDGSTFRLGMELYLQWIARVAEAASTGQMPANLVAAEAEIIQELLSWHPLARWLDLWEKISRLKARCESVNLDRKQVVVTAFLELEARAA